MLELLRRPVMSSSPVKPRTPKKTTQFNTASLPQSLDHACPRSLTPEVSSSTPAHCIIKREYTISIPLVHPKPSFLKILHKAGAKGEVFSKKEICHHLKEYIGSRRMYDPWDPSVVYCQNDELGEVFQLDKFTIADVLGLLAKHCYPLPDTRIKKTTQLVSCNHRLQACPGKNSKSQTVGQENSSRTQVPASPRQPGNAPGAVPQPTVPESNARKLKQNNVQTPDVPTFKGRKRKRSEKSSSESNSESSRRRRKNSLSISESTAYPWYFSLKMESDDSEILSIQSKETVQVKDSSDDLWFVQSDEISLEVDSDVFSVEYDVESLDSNEDYISGASLVGSGEDVLVLCNESDVEFWADSSDIQSDTELSDEDKWSCSECWNLNSRKQRYCDRCWKMRSNWVPSSESLNNSREGDQCVSSNFNEPDSESKKQLPDSVSCNAKPDPNPDHKLGPVLDHKLGPVLDHKLSPVSDHKLGPVSDHKLGPVSDHKLGPVSDNCMICLSRPKDASLIHGSTGHQVCCYQCARRLRQEGKPCPVCRRKIQKVIRNYLL